MGNTIFEEPWNESGVFVPTAQPQKNAQTRVYEFMRKFQAEHRGIPPTLDEIAAAIGVNNRSSSKHYITRLIAAGLVKEMFEEGQPRRYVALGFDERRVEIPDIGTALTPKGEWPSE